MHKYLKTLKIKTMVQIRKKLPMNFHRPMDKNIQKGQKIPFTGRNN